jgi:DNA replication and repair protein RecF
MFLENINLFNFKNYQELNLTFSPQINCFVGENGSGKTNLLDAIHYLSLTKSAFSSVDSQNIRHEEAFFMVKGDFFKDEKKHTVQCNLQSGQKKVVKHNKVDYEKLAEHIGQFPVVMIAPDDTSIIKEGSENRRKFFDGILSQLDRNYLDNLMRYNHVLKQRNSLLKQFAERNYLDKDLLEPYDIQIINLGLKISETRKIYLEQFLPLFVSHYQDLSDHKEKVDLVYESDVLETDFKERFVKNVRKDLALQRTTMGVHKDDFNFVIDGYPLKKFGSQGQQKSFLIALKLTQFDTIHQAKGFKPVLLLDDIFDKLDDKRIDKLMQMVSGHSFGQLFVTDARPERTKRIFDKIDAPKKVFLIEKAEVREV